MHQTLRDPFLEIREDEREERREREQPDLLLRRAGQVPEHTSLLIPALGHERIERSFGPALEAFRIRRTNGARKLREDAKAVSVNRIHHHVREEEHVEERLPLG